jgi:hypothetical protein
MSKLMEITKMLAALVIAASLSVGCASGPDNVEDDFGNSVRAMRRAQTSDPLTLISTDTTPIESTDGQRMEGALESMRSSTSQPDKITQPIQINVD